MIFETAQKYNSLVYKKTAMTALFLLSLLAILSLYIIY